MKRSISSRITKTASVMIILVLLIGGTIYLRTISNAESLDNRNLRELSRIGQGVEGRINNLGRVLDNLASLAEDSTKKTILEADSTNPEVEFSIIENIEDRAKLIPYLSINTSDQNRNICENIDAGKIAFKTELATDSFELCKKTKISMEIKSPQREIFLNRVLPLQAEYSFESLRPTLSSEYMETIFLANENGAIFIWETERTGVRIHELASLDTLQFKKKPEKVGIGKSDILQTSIAGQEYRFYLLPIRVHLIQVQDTTISNSEYTKWILGGLVPLSEYRQQSFSLDPNMALFLGFLVIAGFLIVPFVRIFTMGPKERLKVGNLFYLVAALIFGSGMAGLWLADVVHFSPLKENVQTQLGKTANQMALNIDSELQSAIEELEKKTDSLNSQLTTAGVTSVLLDNIKGDTTLHSVRMKKNIPFDTNGTYPFYHMVFWTDSTGQQIAKWTPRANNTPPISVAEREYFKAIQQDRGWTNKFYSPPSLDTCENTADQKFVKFPYSTETIRSWTPELNLAAVSFPWVHTDCLIKWNRGNAAITNEFVLRTSNPHPTTFESTAAPKTVNLPYYIQSIRSWTTGENLAIISLPWVNKDGKRDGNRGVAAITTELASLSNPVLPAGVGFAVVDADARTLFHSRPERILDENFAEETSNEDLLKSILAARSIREIEMNYEGQNKLMVIRPLNERPLFLILFKDLPLVDTVRFEAWFEGGALFGLWALLILLLIFFREQLSSSRMDWLWPDLKKPENYAVFALYSLPFILLFTIQALTEGHHHIHPFTIVIPILYLGLGLLIFSHDISSAFNGYKILLVWVLLLVSILFTGWHIYKHGLEATPFELVAITFSLVVLLFWLSLPKFQKYIKRGVESSPRGAYTTAMVSGLLVLGLLPGYLTYRFTFHDHSEHLVKYHQIELAESLQNRQARLNDLMQKPWKQNHLKSDKWWDPMANTPELSDHAYDLAYHDLIFETKLQTRKIPEHENSPGIDLHDSMHGFLGDHIPFLTDVSIRMRQLSSEQADRSWVSDHHKNELQLSGSTPAFLTSQLPLPGSWLSLLNITIMLSLVGLLSLIVYRVSRRVFFVHLEHSDPLTLDDVLPKPGESWRSTIVVGTRSISRAPLTTRSPEIHYINMIEDVDNSGDLKKLHPNETKVLCLDYFDHRIDEKERNLFLLKLLEKNASANNSLPLLLLTSRELDETLLTANIAEEQKETIKHRWERVLGRFSKMILSDYVHDAPFKTQLRLRIIAKITDDIDKLLVILNRHLAQGSPADNTTEFDQSLAKLALKTRWLKKELQTLASQSTALTGEQQIAAESFKNRWAVLLQSIKRLTETLSRDNITGKQNDWIEMLTTNISTFNELIDQIIRGSKKQLSEGKEEDNQDHRNSEFFPNTVLNKVFNKKSIRLLTDTEMEARREVNQDKKKTYRVYHTLVEECGHHQRLHEIGEQITYRPDWHKLTKQEIIDLVRDGAEAHYRARWAILSKGEQLVAAQLSRGAVVNPKSNHAVSKLYARGLIRKRPELSFDNNSFSDFVKNTVSDDQLHSWERAGIPSKWEMIRAPLVIALIIVALFLFWSQREFMGNTVAFLGTIGVGVGAIFNLLSKLSYVTGTPDLKTPEK